MAERGWRASYLDHLEDEARERDLDGFSLDGGEGQGRGEVLEHLIAHTLDHAGIPGRHRVWSNVLVPADGAVDTAELDVCLLCDRAICVFEAKNYAGWIFGDEDKRAWAQAMGTEGKRHFRNPIMQNAAHVEALAQALVVPDAAVTSYIVFSDRARIDRLPRSGDDWRLCRLQDLRGIVLHDLAARPVAFTGLQLTTLEDRICALERRSTASAREAHARRVRQARAATTCPRCGAMLVEREGPYGRFWGCTAYPGCTYTRAMR